MKLSHRISQLAQSVTLTLLLATVLVVPLLFSPDLGAWRGVKPIVFEVLALTLMGLALAQAAVPRGSQRILEFLRAGPNLPIVLLVLYGAFSWSRSSSPALSGTEWLRLACGAGLYVVVATMLHRREQVKTVVDILMAVAILTSLVGFVAYGQPEATSMSSSFGNRQLFAAFLLMLVPLMLVLSFSEVDPRRKIAAQVAAVISVSALLMAQTRSSWLGAIVALVALGVMALRYAAPGTSFARQKHQMVLPLVIVVGALSLFLLVSRTAPILTARATTLTAPTQDLSFGWRLEKWMGALELIRQRPLTGWGIGSFPIEQSRTVPDALPRALVERTGPTLAEQAHNEYLQVAAEMGGIGLALTLWVVGAFLLYGLRALRVREHGYRKLVLMGCLAAVAGQSIDALSNPAWRFADVSFMFWLMMGLGMAAARVPRPASREAVAGVPEPGLASGFGRLSWQGTALGLTILAIGGAWAQFDPNENPLAEYPGPVELRIEPSSATLAPGQCVEFRLLARVNQAGFVDVTDTDDTQFRLVQQQSRYCLVNNVAADPELGASDNVFCVPLKACEGVACGGPRQLQIEASFLSRADSIVQATVNVVCP
jgi:O-antigen ligase